MTTTAVIPAPLASLNPRLRPLSRLVARSAAIFALMAFIQLAVRPEIINHEMGTWLIYWLYILFGVALPGTLILLRTVTWRGDWLTSIGLGWAVGHVFELIGLLIARPLGHPRLFLIWIPLAYLVFLIPPALPDDRIVPLPHFGRVVAALLPLFLIGACIFLFFHRVELSDHPHALSDEWFHINNIHAFRDERTFQNPRLAGEPMNYHLFSYAPAAAASLVSNTAGIDLLERYTGVSALFLVTLLIFNTGRVLSKGSVLAGMIGGALFLVPIDLFSLISTRLDFGTTVLAVGIYASTTTLGGFIFFSALLLALLCWYRDGRLRDVWIIGALAFAATGAKGVVGPLLLCASFGLAAWYLLFQRRLERRSLVLCGVITLATVPVTISLAFGDESEANLTRWQFNAFARVTSYYHTLTAYGVPTWFVGSLWILGFAVLFLVGAGLATWMCRGRDDQAPYLVFIWALFCASLVPTICFWIFGQSQVFFLYYGLVALGGVAGYGLASTGVALLRRRAALLTCVAGLLATLAIAQSIFPGTFSVQNDWIHHMRSSSAAIHDPSEVVNGEAVQYTHVECAAGGSCARLFLTPDIRDGLVWMRSNTPPSSVFAVNIFNASPYGGYSERDAFFETAYYTLPGNLASETGNYDGVNQYIAWRRAIIDQWRTGDPTTLAHMKAAGITYLFVDRVNGFPVAELPGTAPPVYDSTDFSIYKIG